MNADEISDRDFVEWRWKQALSPIDAGDLLRLRALASSGSHVDYDLTIAQMCQIATIRLDLVVAIQRAREAEDRLEELEDVDRILADALTGDGFTYFGVATKAMALVLAKQDQGEKLETAERALEEARRQIIPLREAAVLIEQVSFSAAISVKDSDRFELVGKKLRGASIALAALNPTKEPPK